MKTILVLVGMFSFSAWAQIDTSMYGRIQPVQLGHPMDYAIQAQQIQQMQLQNQMMQMQIQQREQQEAEARQWIKAEHPEWLKD